MIEAVFIGTLAPMLFLLFVLKEDGRRLILFFLWGMCAALGAYYLNGYLQYRLGLTLADTSVKLAPYTEEALKALPLVAYLFTRRQEQSYEVVRNAMAVGIGFSILENIAYLTVLAPEGMRSAIGFVALRSVSACVLHGTACALTGYAVRQSRVYRILSVELIVGALITAMLVHALFNRLTLVPSAWFLCVLVPATLFAVEIVAWNFFGKRAAAIPPAILEREQS